MPTAKINHIAGLLKTMPHGDTLEDTLLAPRKRAAGRL